MANLLKETKDNPGDKHKPFCELIIVTSILYLFILYSSARKELIASTIKNILSSKKLLTNNFYYSIENA